ncbi:hypothetical protein [Paenibacillus terrigena]|uniref:hypothetical protein n=1 Tax=Paenibacillus terrigena TaxID=369333 RepID=UPI0028D82214|nr:hypothetical protein [Paenibacillus terrigena]
MGKNDISNRYPASDSDFPLNPDDESQSQPISSQPISTFERIGGMDGVMTIVGQLQQAYGLYKQMVPTFQLFSSFMGPKAMVQNVKHKKNRIKQQPRVTRNTNRKLRGKRTLNAR